MKKAISLLSLLSLLLILFFPAGTLLSAAFGYAFELCDHTLFAVLTALISGAATALAFLSKGRCGKAASVFFSVSTPLSLVNLLVYLLKTDALFAVLCLLLCSGCCFLSAVTFERSLFLKVISFSLAALLLFPASFFGLLWIPFAHFGERNVVETVVSPNNTCYAEVIEGDQGATGGDTLVYVYRRGINLLLFRTVTFPRLVYIGECGEHQAMQIHWEDEHRLIINGQAYPAD